MKSILYAFFLLFLVNFFSTGCTKKESNQTIKTITEIIDSNPTQALEYLDSIDPTTLSESDRHLFDFLSIKAKDKAYVWHTSDSLILDVKDWYYSHPKSGLYPEVVYYTGRVYSDLGDKPTALRYFQEALDVLPENGENRNLKLRILSQTGRLLTSLRLHNEAEKYIQKSLSIAQEINDTILVVQELQLLGSNLLSREEYHKSWLCFEQALNWSSNLPDRFKAHSLMYQALIRHRTGDSKGATELIKGIPARVHPASRNNAMANAAYIFRKANMPDSAMKYALQLIHSNDRTKKEVGYDVFFSILVSIGSFPDSINNHLDNYRAIHESLYNDNESQFAIAQQTLYNYRKHDIDRKMAEDAKNRSIRWLYITVGCLMLALIIILYVRYQKQKRIIMLQTSLSNLMQLKEELQRENQNLRHSISNKNASIGSSLTYTNLQPVGSDEKELRERLKSELLNIAENNKEKYSVPVKILRSDAYRKLQEKIEKGKIINESDQLWEEIENVVTICSPNFRNKLNLLTSGHLTVIDFHTALLLKCGIKPSHMAILEGRSQGSIVSRRETLGLKALDKKTGLAIVDKVIQSL